MDPGRFRRLLQRYPLAGVRTVPCVPFGMHANRDLRNCILKPTAVRGSPGWRDRDRLCVRPRGVAGSGVVVGPDLPRAGSDYAAAARLTIRPSTRQGWHGIPSNFWLTVRRRRGRIVDGKETANLGHREAWVHHAEGPAWLKSAGYQRLPARRRAERSTWRSP